MIQNDFVQYNSINLHILHKFSNFGAYIFKTLDFLKKL